MALFFVASSFLIKAFICNFFNFSPALIAAWLLSFSLSLDDVIISFFVSGPSYQILPLQIYAMVRLGVKPEINALCTLLFATTVILVLSAQHYFAKNESS